MQNFHLDRLLYHMMTPNSGQSENSRCNKDALNAPSPPKAEGTWKCPPGSKKKKHPERDLLK